MYNFIKQLEEKNVAHEITHMVWSDRMDLVAYANIKGEVALHRLTWTRAWILQPPKDGLLVAGLVWRPDGKILAVAYSSGEVLLIGIENKNILNKAEINGNITFLSWVQEKVEVKPKNNIQKEDLDDNDYVKYIDYSSTFLPEPAAPPGYEPQISKFLIKQSALNVLLIGTKDGFVHMYLFGCFACAIINVSEHVGYSCCIESIHLTENLSYIFVTIKDIQNKINIVVLESKILHTHTKELYAIAMKYVQIMDLDTYLSNSIASILESWESILLEIDNKLSKYASGSPVGSVTADFLDLLMFGICSSKMEQFLIHDLTKKGLEKFGQTIEMRYVNIQKILLKSITKFGQCITFHLAELRGMARFTHKYKVLGLSEEKISEAIGANGSFLIKTSEMQQIINQSLSNYRAFFRWLYTAMMHIVDEPVPSDIYKMTQQDLAYITEFLQNFDHLGVSEDKIETGFIMERIGQYISSDPLKISPNMEGNDWSKFLAEIECLQKHPSVLKHYENLSFVQQYKLLKESLKETLQLPKETISQQIKFSTVLNGFQFGDNKLKMASVNMSSDIILFSFLKPNRCIYLLQVLVNSTSVCYARCGVFHFSNIVSDDTDQYQILDTQFFSYNVLSLLLQENGSHKTGVLHQFYVGDVLEKLTDIDLQSNIQEGNFFASNNGSVMSPKLFKRIDGMVGSQFAVSGSRRVGIVLAENRKKIRLFEMGIEEEEDEDDADMTASTMRESDISMQEPSLIE